MKRPGRRPKNFRPPSRKAERRLAAPLSEGAKDEARLIRELREENNRLKDMLRVLLRENDWE
jgi:hypothetical protein